MRVLRFSGLIQENHILNDNGNIVYFTTISNWQNVHPTRLLEVSQLANIPNFSSPSNSEVAAAKNIVYSSAKITFLHIPRFTANTNHLSIRYC